MSPFLSAAPHAVLLAFEWLSESSRCRYHPPSFPNSRQSLSIENQAVAFPVLYIRGNDSELPLLTLSLCVSGLTQRVLFLRQHLPSSYIDSECFTLSASRAKLNSLFVSKAIKLLWPMSAAANRNYEFVARVSAASSLASDAATIRVLSRPELLPSVQINSTKLGEIPTFSHLYPSKLIELSRFYQFSGMPDKRLVLIEISCKFGDALLPSLPTTATTLGNHHVSFWVSIENAKKTLKRLKYRSNNFALSQSPSEEVVNVTILRSILSRTQSCSWPRC